MEINGMEHTSAKGVIAVTLFRLLLFVAVIGGPVAGLWFAADSLERGTVNAWAALATALLVPTFAIGFWFGKVEARGFLGGIDAALEKMAKSVGTIDDAVTKRSKREKPQQPSINIYSERPMLPAISHRGRAGDDEVIDL
jgi:hypothetical protein